MDTPPIELTTQRGRVRLRLRCLSMGADLCVTLSGGDREHIGAVALSRVEPGGTEPITALLTVPGHREDELTRRLAARLATRLGTTVCLACGIHVDALQSWELTEVLDMAEELADALVERLGAP